MSIKRRKLFETREVKDLKELLNTSADMFKEKVAFMEKRNKGAYENISYEQFKIDVDALGTFLCENGLKDKRIAIIGENCYYWCVAYMAVVCGTGVVVPLDVEMPDDDIKNAIKQSQCSAIFYTKSQDRVLNIVDGIITYEMYDPKYIEEGKKLISDGKKTFIDATIDKYGMQIMLFTSGTTGNSKIVMLSHHNLVSDVIAISKIFYADTNDRFLAVLPLHHTFECTCGFLCPLFVGSAIGFIEGLRYLPQNMIEVRPTIIICVPLILEALYKKILKQAQKSGQDKKLKIAIKINNILKQFGFDLSRKLFKTIHDSFGGQLKIMLSGAAALENSIGQGLRDLGLYIVEGYGLTECSPVAAGNMVKYYRNCSAGMPLPGVEIRINAPDERGIGEILIKGPIVMLGYYNNEQETNNVLKDGWLYSGDLGYIDKDGFVHITGRKKNVIVTKNGKNIYPEEIETLLLENDSIKDCVVLGKEQKGEMVVYAEILPDYENLEEQDIEQLIKEIVLNVNMKVQGYKMIVDYKIRTEDFERTSTKKIKRHKI